MYPIDWSSTTLLEKEWQRYLAENLSENFVEVSCRTHAGNFIKTSSSWSPLAQWTPLDVSVENRKEMSNYNAYWSKIKFFEWWSRDGNAEISKFFKKITNSEKNNEQNNDYREVSKNKCNKEVNQILA